MSLYIDAAHCRPTSRAPIWIMRQAGRYLPEYRAFRDKYGFLDMIRTPEIATEITLQPIRRFGFDAAILFSDILTVANALGADLSFVEGKGPVIANPVRSLHDASQLVSTDIRLSLDYVSRAITLLKSELGATPLIGFAGAPFTVASYMVEGSSSRDLRTLKQFMYSAPDAMEELMDRLVRATADYLNMQIEAGVDSIQIFDTWAGLLSYPEFQEWVIRPIRALLNRLRNPAGVPITIFAKGTSAFWNDLTQLPIQVLGVDWQADIPALGQLINPGIALQGNLDPMMLYSPSDVLKKRVLRLLEPMANRPGYIFNLGHGILPDVNPDQVKLVVDTVKEYGYERVYS
ncbi:uroporphyrinogen decarboxylase [bacterium]|nr:uroporphyrinogen decarboxylase [bacterium]